MRSPCTRRTLQSTLALAPSTYSKQSKVVSGKRSSKLADATTHFYLHSRPRLIPWLRGRQTKVVLVSFKTMIDSDGELQSEPEVPLNESVAGGSGSGCSAQPEDGASPLSAPERQPGGVGRRRRRRRAKVRTAAAVRGRRRMNVAAAGQREVVDGVCATSATAMSLPPPHHGRGGGDAVFTKNINGNAAVNTSTTQRTSIRILLQGAKPGSSPAEPRGHAVKTVEVDIPPPPVIVKQEVDDSALAAYENDYGTSSVSPNQIPAGNLTTVALEYFQNAQRMVQLRAQLQQSDARKLHYTSEVDLAQQQIRELKNTLINFEGKCNELEKQLKREQNGLEKVKKEIDDVRSKQCHLLLHKGELSPRNGEVKHDANFAVTPSIGLTLNTASTPNSATNPNIGETSRQRHNIVIKTEPESP